MRSVRGGASRQAYALRLGVQTAWLQCQAARKEPATHATAPAPRRLTGVDEMVISLAVKGLTTGEISAHLAEVYGAEMSRQTISTITDKVIEGMVEWGEPAAGPGLSGDLHRRDPREDP